MIHRINTLFLSAVLCLGLSSIAFAQNDFKELDEFASKKVSTSIAKDYIKLAKHLTDPYDTEIEKVRSIYVWITHNIRYDVSAFFNGTKFYIEPNEVLKRKRGVCGAYSSLFKNMCDEVGIDSRDITGYSKGYGYRKGKVRENLHAWNTVKIDGKWYLLDLTWGAGHIDNARKFHFEFSEEFWLSDPDKFAELHFPWSPMWQLNDSPLSFEDFVGKGVSTNQHPNYAFSDTIARFDAMNSPEKEIAIAASAKAYDSENSIWLADEYMIAGEKLLFIDRDVNKPTDDVAKLKQAKIYFELSIPLWKISKGDVAKHNYKACKTNANYCEVMIEQLSN